MEGSRPIQRLLPSAALTLGFTLALSACATNPVTGKREIVLVSEEQEVAMGQQSDPAVVAEYGVYNDAKVTRYVDSLGQALARSSQRPNLKWQFRVLDSPVVNAFALPGGYVYITRGILSHLTSEAQLAGILGHEIGHIAARHSVKQITQQQLIGLGAGIGGAILDAKLPGLGGAGSQLAQVSSQLLFLKYSRDDEREADALGVQYATKLHYDTHPMADFFTVLQKITEASGSSLPEWEQTHPDPGGRAVTVNRLSTQEQQKYPQVRTWEINHTNLYRKIDGIVFGEDPRQGYVESGVFRHPTLNFQFPVPNGWRVNNAPTQVQMGSPKGDAVVAFGTAQGSAAAAAQQFASTEGLTVTGQQQTTINGYPAIVITGTGTTQQGQIAILSYFINKDNATYVFQCLSAAGNFNALSPTFRQVAEGFRQIPVGTALRTTPDRVSVVRVPAGAALQTLIAKNPPPAPVKPSDIALINGLALTATIPAGDDVKLVVRR